MTIIEINGRHYNIPEKWNELSTKQLLQVMKLFYCSSYSIERAKLKLLKILSGMSWWHFFRAPMVACEKQFFPILQPKGSITTWLYLNRMECTGLEEYLYLTDFLIEKKDITKQLLPEYKSFYGPSDECNNLRGIEFAHTEHFYMSWAAQLEDPQSDSSNTQKLLDNLVAVLYRPRKKNYDITINKEGDARIAFNDKLCEWFATTVIYGWPLHVKMAIASFYGACREKWVSDNQDLFGGTGEAAKYGLLSVMRDVAKSGVHGDFKQVEQLHVFMIMMELNEQVHEQKNAEKTNKST